MNRRDFGPDAERDRCAGIRDQSRLQAGQVVWAPRRWPAQAPNTSIPARRSGSPSRTSASASAVALSASLLSRARYFAIKASVSSARARMSASASAEPGQARGPSCVSAHFAGASWSATWPARPPPQGGLLDRDGHRVGRPPAPRPDGVRRVPATRGRAVGQGRSRVGRAAQGTPRLSGAPPVPSSLAAKKRRLCNAWHRTRKYPDSRDHRDRRRGVDRPFPGLGFSLTRFG